MFFSRLRALLIELNCSPPAGERFLVPTDQSNTSPANLKRFPSAQIRDRPKAGRGTRPGSPTLQKLPVREARRRIVLVRKKSECHAARRDGFRDRG